MINFTTPTKAPDIPFSKQQLAPINNTVDSAILVNSTAGSGKTALLQKIAFDNQDKRVVYLAYNKPIVEDIRTKLPVNCDVSTFHAFGLSVIRDNLKSFKVNFNKYRNIQPMYGVADLISKHMSLGGARSKMKWIETCDRYYMKHDLIPEAMQALEDGFKKKNIISAEDMISMPIRENYDFPAYDIVLVDEYQDIGMDKLQMLSRIPTGKIIFVGDLQQKINSFMGSDPYIEQNIDRAFNPALYDINETFRCPARVVEEARKYFPKITTNKTGGASCRVPVNEMEADDFPDDSLIVCRANAPLLKLAKKFIRANMKFKINPATIKKFATVIKRLSRSTSNINLIKKACLKEQKSEIERFAKSGWNPEIPSLKYDAIYEILSVGSSLGEAETFVKKLTNTNVNKCARTLSTIHSAKGLESENVFYLDQKIGQRIEQKTEIPWQKVEERNLHFVAITRSLKNLTFVD